MATFRRACGWLAILLAMAACAIAAAPHRSKPPLRRAARPAEWDPRETAGVFFQDAFEQGLVGDRPSQLGLVKADGGARQLPTETTPGGSSVSGADAWSTIISAETIEDEVKAIKARIDTVVTTPAKFAGGDFVAARHQFSVAALLFAVISEYDGNIRWKADASVARDLFAHAAAVSKAGSLQAFQVARARKTDLQELVGGGRVRQGLEATASGWEQLADRAPLMKRMELAQQERLARWTANKSEFVGNKTLIVHEAELVGAIGHALTREGMEDSGDQEYTNHCKRLKELSRQIIRAVQDNNHDAARTATGAMTNTCNNCHEVYRG
jgi:hypothetical protein